MSETTLLTRNLLSRAFDDPRLIHAFEELEQRVLSVTDAASGSADAVTGLNAAEVLVMAATTAIQGARILAEGNGISIVNDGETVTITIDGTVPQVRGGRNVTFITTADTLLVLPEQGTLVTTGDISPAGNYANDAAAAAGGVEVGQLYRNGSAMMIRVA